VLLAGERVAELAAGGTKGDRIVKAVWKYELSPETAVRMPQEAKVLTVQTQSGKPCLWAEVDPARPTVLRRFATYGTSHTMPDEPGRYIGTFQLETGFVFHVYEPATDGDSE
jgi:hypothetical protein